MTTRSTRPSRAGPEAPSTWSGAELARLRARLQEQMTGAGELITALQSDVIRYRTESRALRRQRDRLRHLLMQLDIVRLRQEARTARLSRRSRDRDRLESAWEELSRDNARLRSRCVELEDTLAREREALVNARRDIAQLNDQIDQIQRLVEQLPCDPEDG